MWKKFKCYKNFYNAWIYVGSKWKLLFTQFCKFLLSDEIAELFMTKLSCVVIYHPAKPQPSKDARLDWSTIHWLIASGAIPDGRKAACCWNCMLARACWYWSMPVLNMAVAPLAFSRAARFGRGAMTLGVMPCPSTWREDSEKENKKKRQR